MPGSSQAPARKILGIDPGTRRVGLCLYDCRAFRPKKVAAIQLDPSAPVATRLARLATILEDYLTRWKPDLAVIEEIPSLWRGRAAASTKALNMAVGAVVAVCGLRSIPVRFSRITDARRGVEFFGSQVEPPPPEVLEDPDICDAYSLAFSAASASL